MKSLTIILVAMLIASTAFGMSKGDEFTLKPKNTVDVAFERAICVPGLVVAMLQQLDGDILYNNQPFYTLEVSYGGTIYRITGSCQQWLLFFKLQWEYPIGH